MQMSVIFLKVYASFQMLTPLSEHRVTPITSDFPSSMIPKLHEASKQNCLVLKRHWHRKETLVEILVKSKCLEFAYQ